MTTEFLGYLLRDKVTDQYWCGGWHPWGSIGSAKLYKRKGDVTVASKRAREEFDSKYTQLDKNRQLPFSNQAHIQTAFEDLHRRIYDLVDYGLEVVTMKLVPA